VRRSAELSGLSREHHVALAVALGLRRVEESELASAVQTVRAFFAEEGEPHFAAEEEHLLADLPDAMARRLVSEHADLRSRVASLTERPAVEHARELGRRLAAHVRFEEREVFPHLEDTLAPERLAEIGRRLA
jgi:hypothetical protein